MRERFVKVVKDFRDLIVAMAAIVAVVISALAYFTPASAFNAHIKADDIKDLTKQRWEAAQQMSHCARQLQEFGSLTIMETTLCQTAEQTFIFTSEKLCGQYNMFCPER